MRPRLLARLPVRARLTLAFTGVMAILLTAASIALSLLVASNLDSTINDGLEARAGDAAALVRTGANRGRLIRSGEAFAQLLSPAGRVIDTTPGAGPAPLLSPAETARARLKVVIADRPGRKGEQLRLYARPARPPHGREVVPVG